MATTNFEKSYIGKGKKVNGMNIVRVTIPLASLQEIAYDYDGTSYVSFEIAEMKEADQFGRTHSCYFSKKVQAAKKAPAKAKKTKISSKAKEPAAF